MYQMNSVVAGTGHRPPKLGGYSEDVFTRLTLLAFDWLVAYKPYKPINVISGMALGWDQALAVGAIALNIPVTAAVPCENYESRWPASSIKTYKQILDQCQEIVYVNKRYTGPHVMQARNEWMVDRCNILLALWDGSSGGTRNCVKYAEQKGVIIENLWDKYVP